MHHIKLPTEQLREFLSISKYVVTDKSDLVPILKFIKCEIVFGECTLSKYNLKSFCQYSFSTKSDDISFLIAEDDLLEFCGLTKKPEIEIIINGGYEKSKLIELEGIITLYDGYYKPKFNVGGYNINDFKIFPSIPENGIKIGKDILNILDVAKVQISKDDLRPSFCCAYLDENKIYSSDANSLFYKEHAYNFPKIPITKTECDFISKFDEVTYFAFENYNIYKNKNTVCGFIRLENSNGFPYQQILNQIKKENYIKIKISDLINFCTSTLAFIKDAFCVSRIEVENGVARMIYIDYEKRNENVIETNVELFGEEFSFNFPPKGWLDMLKAMPYDVICLADEGSMISFFTEFDPKYSGLIMKSI